MKEATAANCGRDKKLQDIVPCELTQAQMFITALTGSPDAAVTFQTVDDKGKQRGWLTRKPHGTLAQHRDELERLNAAGAGVFVTINETDGQGRTTANVVSVRALFADFDGAPLPETWPLPPHIIVESSPGRWHAYWPVADVPLALFSTLQTGLAAIYGSDPAVKDLPRAMRLPGFIHYKRNPQPVRLGALRADLRPYSLAEMLEAMPELRAQLEAAQGEREAKERRRLEARQREPQTVSNEQVQRLLDAHYDAVATAAPGVRHDTLVSRARTLGGYVGGGDITRQAAADTLTQAAVACGLPELEATAAIEWGLKAGEADPLVLECSGPPDQFDNHGPASSTTGRYFGELKLQPGVTCLQGQMGTGKTEAVARWLEHHPEVSTLAISHLQALTGTLSTRLRLADYRDVPPGYAASILRAAFCVNSLHKLAEGGQVHARDVVFIDEIEQLLERLTSRRQFERKRECLAVLEFLVRSAAYVVVADAHLSSTTARWLKRLRPDDKHQLVTNAHKPAEGRILHLHQHRGDVRAEALAALQAGKRVYYSANSRETAASVYQHLTAEAGLADGTALLVTSHTAAAQDVLVFFRRPSLEAARYQLVVASPSVSTGVSIDAPGFDVVCGEYTAQVATPYDAMQALSRVRQAASTHVWVDKTARRQPTDRAAIRSSFDDLRQGEKADDAFINVDALTGERTVESSYIDLYLDVKARTNAARNNYRQLFLELAETAGYVVTEGAAHAGAKEHVTAAREAAVAANLEALTTAEAVSDDAAQALQAKGARQTLTTDERHKLERHALATFYRFDIHDSETLGVVATQDKKGERRRHVRRLELAGADEVTVGQMMTAQAGTLTPDIVRHDRQAAAYRHTLEVVGVNAQTLDASADRYTADELRERWLAPLAEVWDAYAVTVPGWPSWSYANTQPVKALGSVLRAMGLRQRREGDNGTGTYSVDAEQLAEMKAICRLRAKQTDVSVNTHTAASVCTSGGTQTSTPSTEVGS